MKYLQWVGVLVVMASLAGCHKAQAHLTSQTKPLLASQKNTLAHSQALKTGKHVQVLVPKTAAGKDLIDSQPYAQTAKAALTNGKTQAAYVTFVGKQLVNDYWQLTPTLRVYQLKADKTQLVKKTQLKAVNVNVKTAQALTAGSLMQTTAQLQAVNYQALKTLVDGKHYSAADLAQAQALTWLKDLQATNFAIDDKQLTIYPATNALHIKKVAVPLTAINTYLSKWQPVSAPAATAQKLVALTFDDGPNPQTTPQVLAILAQNQVPATFFMLGEQVALYPTLAAQVAAHNEVGTHTYGHQNIATLTPAAALKETNTATAAMYAATGKLPTLLRPPYGAMDLAHDGLVPLPAIQWSVDSEDWTVNAPGPIISRIDHSVYPGSIILMHDIHPQSVAALPTVIQHLKAQGYQFVTVSQLLGTQLLPGEQYYGAGDHRGLS